jgi:hypothetical protein
MRYIAGALIVLAWLVTTDQIISIKVSGQDTLTPVYQAYCTTQKTVSWDGKNRYKIETATGTVYVPMSSSRVEPVEKCP